MGIPPLKHIGLHIANSASPQQTTLLRELYWAVGKLFNGALLTEMVIDVEMMIITKSMRQIPS
jgi:hypothetical protein